MILNYYVVEAPIINAEVKATIKLLVKKDGSTCRRLKGANKPSL